MTLSQFNVYRSSTTSRPFRLLVLFPLTYPTLALAQATTCSHPLIIRPIRVPLSSTTPPSILPFALLDIPTHTFTPMPPRPHSSIPLRPSQEFDRNLIRPNPSSHRDSSYTQASWDPSTEHFASRYDSSSQHKQSHPRSDRYRDYPPSSSGPDGYDSNEYGGEYLDHDSHDIYAGTIGLFFPSRSYT